MFGFCLNSLLFKKVPMAYFLSYILCYPGRVYAFYFLSFFRSFLVYYYILLVIDCSLNLIDYLYCKDAYKVFTKHFKRARDVIFFVSYD